MSGERRTPKRRSGELRFARVPSGATLQSKDFELLLGPRERSEVDESFMGALWRWLKLKRPAFNWPRSFWQAQIQYVARLTDEEKQLINAYAGQDYQGMNAFLRSSGWRPELGPIQKDVWSNLGSMIFGNPVESLTLASYRKMGIKWRPRRSDILQSVILHAPVTPAAGLLFRGIQVPWSSRSELRKSFAKLRPGRVSKVSGFQSWSYDPNVAIKFALAGREEGIVLVLRVPPAVPVLWANALEGIFAGNEERELILPHGSALRFVGRLDKLGGVYPRRSSRKSKPKSTGQPKPKSEWKATFGKFVNLVIPYEDLKMAWKALTYSFVGNSRPNELNHILLFDYIPLPAPTTLNPYAETMFRTNQKNAPPAAFASLRVRSNPSGRRSRPSIPHQVKRNPSRPMFRHGRLVFPNFEPGFKRRTQKGPHLKAKSVH